jgi:hypothetical protein
MPRFITERDARFFYNVNNELINDVVETEIQIFKTVIQESNPDDIYGESIGRKYYTGVRINCLINRSDSTVDSTNFGQNVLQSIVFSINREFAKQKNVYPENGDIVQWNSYLYEIDHVVENQYIAGRSDQDLNWSFVCTAHLTNISQINISERQQ